MAKLTWDDIGKKLYETGVDHGVLYVAKSGAYPTGVAWNGLTAVTESPSGAESNPQYADNIKYLDLSGAEEFGMTIEAFTWPEEFGVCDGTADFENGATLGQQSRKPFGLCYRTKIGNDTDGQDHGYKLHLVYGCKAAPSEKAYSTVNDSPEALTFSWEVTTTPVPVEGKDADGLDLRPVSCIIIDSTKATSTGLAALEKVLYGSDEKLAEAGPRLPLPAEVKTLLATV